MKKHYQCYRYPLGNAYGKPIYGSCLLKEGEGEIKENSELVFELDVDSVDLPSEKELTDSMMEKLFPVRFPVQIDRLIAGAVIASAYDDCGNRPQPLLILGTELCEYDFPGVGAVDVVKLTCLDLTALNEEEPSTYILYERINPTDDENDLEFAEVCYFRHDDEPLCHFLRKREVVKLEVDEDGICVMPEGVEWEDDKLI